MHRYPTSTLHFSRAEHVQLQLAHSELCRVENALQRLVRDCDREGVAAFKAGRVWEIWVAELKRRGQWESSGSEVSGSGGPASLSEVALAIEEGEVEGVVLEDSGTESGIEDAEEDEGESWPAGIVVMD